jgi:hypothetical protein
MTLPADPIPGPIPPIQQPVPVREPEPDRLPDEEPLPNPDENPEPPQQVGHSTRGVRVVQFENRPEQFKRALKQAQTSLNHFMRGILEVA